MTTFTLGDTSPALTGKANANLTGASAVVVHLKRPSGDVLTANATVTDPLTGAWSYAWQSGDLDEIGWWYVELAVTFSGGGAQQTFAKDDEDRDVRFYVRDQIA